MQTERNKRKKIIISGASSAGLFAAYLLAKEGFEIEVYEKENRAAWSERTLIVTGKLGQVLGPELGRAIFNGAIINKIKNIKLCSEKNSVTIKLETPDLIIERQKLLKILAQQAEAQGARLNFGYEILAIYLRPSELGAKSKNFHVKELKDTSEIWVKVKNLATGKIEEIKADYLIGADGYSSVVRTYLFNQRDKASPELVKSVKLENNEKFCSRKDRDIKFHEQNRIFSRLFDTKALLQVKVRIKNQQAEERGIDNFRGVESVPLSKGRIEIKDKVVIKTSAALSKKELSGSPIEKDEESGIKVTNIRRRFNPEICEVFFDQDKTNYFFWLIPESSEMATVGLIAEEMKKAQIALQEFLESKKLIGPDCEIIDEQAGQAPILRLKYLFGMARDGYAIGALKWPKTNKQRCFLKSFFPLNTQDKVNSKVDVTSRIFLVGDAAGQVKASTVGGVVAGLRGAKAVAQLIMGQENGIKEHKTLKRELCLHALLRHILNKFWKEDYDYLLRKFKNDKVMQQILARYNRDELLRFFILLGIKRPYLIFLSIKVLARYYLQLMVGALGKKRNDENEKSFKRQIGNE